MLGRRSHARFNLTRSADGALRILRDVIVQRTQNDEWIAISREASAAGEIVTLDLGIAEAPLRFTVRVLESRPVVIDGGVQHRLRLERVESNEEI